MKWFIDYLFGSMEVAVLVSVAFLGGALPLSVWLGRFALRVDIRTYGDGNPGAANVFRAGGLGWGALALLLDFLKGAIPVGMANLVVGLEGAALVAVAIAPIAGHAFSPFLGFHGGKALAVSFGIWAGLSLWFIPAIFGLLLGFYLLLLKPEGWAVAAGSLSLLVVLLFIGNPIWIGVWAGMALIMGWKQKDDLVTRPQLRFREK